MSSSQRASMEVAMNQCMDVGFSNNTVNLIDSDCTETVNAVPTLSNSGFRVRGGVAGSSHRIDNQPKFLGTLSPTIFGVGLLQTE